MRAGVGRKGRKKFFFEKKSQKTFALFPAGVFGRSRLKIAKVFCGAFLQKSDPLLSLATDRRGLASVEFALCCLLLVIFLFGIINVGDFALVYGTMRHGALSAARTAAVQTGVQIAQTGNTGDCVTNAQVTGFFNGYASMVMPGVGSSAMAPVLRTAWTNNTAANAVSGTFVTVTVNYLWTPVGMPGGTGIPVSVAATDMVEGTSGAAVTTCS
jgi:Flp pilus assembly protein TadG